MVYLQRRGTFITDVDVSENKVLFRLGNGIILFPNRNNNMYNQILVTPCGSREERSNDEDFSVANSRFLWTVNRIDVLCDYQSSLVSVIVVGKQVPHRGPGTLCGLPSVDECDFDHARLQGNPTVSPVSPTEDCHASHFLTQVGLSQVQSPRHADLCRGRFYFCNSCIFYILGTRFEIEYNPVLEEGLGHQF